MKGFPDMKNIIKKALMISCILVLTVMFAGCAKESDDLEITEISRESAAGIVSGINSMDQAYTDRLLEMEPGEIEEFFKQYGYSLDGSAFLSGVSGYLDAVEEMGAVTGIGEPVMTSDDQNIIATFDVKGEKRDAKIIVMMNGRNKIVAITTNCNYTFGENLKKAGLNTVLGMGTTFVILIFLSIIIGLFKYIPDLQEKFANKGAASSKTEAAVDNTINQIIEKEEAADSGELIAVITAAIAAYEAASGGAASSSGDGFVVRSIRRR